MSSRTEPAGLVGRSGATRRPWQTRALAATRPWSRAGERAGLSRGSAVSVDLELPDEPVERKFLGLDGLAWPHELRPLHDHLLPGLKARFHGEQTLVGVERLDDRQPDRVLVVNHQDAGPLLGLDRRPARARRRRPA